MIHPATRIKYIDDTIGYGVFATSFIPQGTITWASDPLDKELAPSEMESLPKPVYETALTYSYRNSKGNYILPWDHTRYVNHSFFANTMLTPYGFEVALRDIQPGEQITNDYGTLNIIESFEPIDEGSERKWVHPDDLKTFGKQWDAAIAAALAQTVKIGQPLFDLVPANSISLVKKILNGDAEPRSIVGCCFASSAK